MVIPVPTWAWQCHSPPNGVEITWRHHQTTKCGAMHKVKLAKGNFITEYLVPTPVHSTIEAKYTMTSTTEFSSVFLVSNSLTTWTLIKLQTATCSIALHNTVDPNDFSEASQWTLRTKCCTHSARHGILFPFSLRTTLCRISPNHLHRAVQARLCHKHCRHVISLGSYRLSMTSYPSP